MYHVFVWELLQPFTLLWLVLGLALANLWRKRRETRRRLLLVILPYMALTLLCLPAVGDLALGSLERQYPPLNQRPPDAQAIVVLSSYAYAPVTPGQVVEMDERAFDRCLKAAEVYHQGPPCPVVVSGGTADPEAGNCAEAMRELLLRLGVRDTDLYVERHSQTTYENAVESAKLLGKLGLARVVLVTDGRHLPRAVACFRKQGLDVEPCGCRYRKWDFEFAVPKFVPKPSVGQVVQEVVHEWLGLLWYRLRGRI